VRHDRTLARGSGLGVILAVASVAALVTFVYVLGFAPIDERRAPRAGAMSRPPGVASTAQRMRALLASGQTTHAATLGAELVGHHPKNATARLEYAQALGIDGRAGDALEQWGRLLAMGAEGGGSEGEGSGSLITPYQRARALVALGRADEARPILLELAESSGGPGGSRGGVDAYNRACYLALAGERERALESWRAATERGFASRSGWWRVDPDLASIRGDDRFWAIVRELGPESVDGASGDPVTVPEEPGAGGTAPEGSGSVGGSDGGP